MRKLYDDLKSRGFDPWLDAVDLMPGQIWKAEIPKAIRQAEIFLACLSRQSIEKRGYVQREFRLALSAFAERPPGSIYLIPVRLDDCAVPDLDIPDLELNLRDIQWVDLWEEGGFDRLVDALQRALGERTTSLPEPGTVLRDAPWCPELVVVPPGEFMMGSPDRDSEASPDERPRHLVRIDYLLAVGRYPVTFEEWDRYAEDEAWHRSKHLEPYRPSDESWGRGKRPVINVSWEDIQGYLRWLSDENGHRYRLLSEAEWEYACRAGATTTYHVGSGITRSDANFGAKVGKTVEVGSYSPNAWGLYDMHGNVWEWVEDCWNGSYREAPNDGSAWTSGDCRVRVLRGGSWNDRSESLRAANRNEDSASFRNYSIGFRVGKTLSRSESVTA